MRRAPSIVTATATALVLAIAAGCDPSPAPSSATTTATATATSIATTAPMGGGPSPSGLSPLSPQAMADQPTPAAPPAAEAEPEVIAAQHLLVAYKGAKGAAKTITRSKADAKKRAEEALAKARKGDDFTALVKTYSDEPGAADRLGNLGKFKREAMVKPFSDAAFKLKVNETSDVVETEFGFHLIVRSE